MHNHVVNIFINNDFLLAAATENAYKSAAFRCSFFFYFVGLQSSKSNSAIACPGILAITLSD